MKIRKQRLILSALVALLMSCLFVQVGLEEVYRTGHYFHDWLMSLNTPAFVSATWADIFFHTLMSPGVGQYDSAIAASLFYCAAFVQWFLFTYLLSIVKYLWAGLNVTSILVLWSAVSLSFYRPVSPLDRVLGYAFVVTALCGPVLVIFLHTRRAIRTGTQM